MLNQYLSRAHVCLIVWLKPERYPLRYNICPPVPWGDDCLLCKQHSRISKCQVKHTEECREERTELPAWWKHLKNTSPNKNKSIMPQTIFDKWFDETLYKHNIYRNRTMKTAFSELSHYLETQTIIKHIQIAGYIRVFAVTAWLVAVARCDMRTFW